MISRKALLLRQFFKLTPKASDVETISMSYGKKQLRERREKAEGNAAGAINKMFREYGKLRSNPSQKRQLVRIGRLGGTIRYSGQYTATRTGSLPAHLLSEEGIASGVGSVGGANERGGLKTPSDKEMLKRDVNPLRQARKISEVMGKEAKVDYDSPWHLLHKQRFKFGSTSNHGKRSKNKFLTSRAYTQFNLENFFGDDPIDVVCRKINDEVLAELLCQVPHVCYSPKNTLKWESAKAMTMASGILRQPLETVGTPTAQKRLLVENREASNASSSSSSLPPLPSFKRVSSRAIKPLHPKAVSAQHVIRHDSILRRHLLKVPSWPLAAVLLDNNPTSNKTYVNLPQLWHDTATGDVSVDDDDHTNNIIMNNNNNMNNHHNKHNAKNASSSSNTASSPSRPLHKQFPLGADVTAKAMMYAETIHAPALLAQSPNATLYQLQVLASMGVPLIALDETMIAAAIDHWHSCGGGAGVGEQLQGSAAMEQLVLLRSIVHLAMARIATQEGLIERGVGAARRHHGGDDNVNGDDADAGGEIEGDSASSPVGGDESVASVSNYLLTTFPSFPKKLAQSTPRLLHYFAAKGMLLDYFEVQWHWLLWMGGGLPESSVLEATDASSFANNNSRAHRNASSLSSSASLTPEEEERRIRDEYWTNLGPSAVADLTSGRREAILSVYPNTVSDECARSAAFAYWRHTCGLSGTAILSAAAAAGVKVRPLSLTSTTSSATVLNVSHTDAKKEEEERGGGGGPSSKGAESSWFAPVHTPFAPNVRKSGPAFGVVDSAVATLPRGQQQFIAGRGDDAVVCSNNTITDSTNNQKDSLFIGGDRPLLHSLHSPLIIVTEVLRGLWDRSPPPSLSPTQTAAPLIPFHRRVAVVEWAAEIVEALSLLHLEILTQTRGEQQTQSERVSSPSSFSSFASLKDELDASPTAPAQIDKNKKATNDLSARLGAAMGEWMDTLIDVCTVVSKSKVMKRQHENTHNDGNPTNGAETKVSSVALSVTTESKSVADASGRGGNGDDQHMSQLIERLHRSLDAALRHTSTLFTRCVEHLLDYPAIVNPFVHVSVVDAARAHRELAQCDYVTQTKRSGNALAEKETSLSSQLGRESRITSELSPSSDGGQEFDDDVEGEDANANEERHGKADDRDQTQSVTDDNTSQSPSSATFAQHFNPDGSIRDGRIRTSLF